MNLRANKAREKELYSTAMLKF